MKTFSNHFLTSNSAQIKNQDGFSILETLAALGIIAIVFSFSIPFFIKQEQTVKQLRTSSNCQSILDSAYSRLDSLGTTLDSYPMHKKNLSITPYQTGLAAPANQAATSFAWTFPSDSPLAGSGDTKFTDLIKLKHPLFDATKNPGFDSTFIDQRLALLDPSATTYFAITDFSTTNPPQLYIENPAASKDVAKNATDTFTMTADHDGVKLYTPLLLSGTMEYLAVKYMNGYCGSSGAAINLLTNKDVDSIKSLYSGGLKSLSLNLAIERYDLTTGNVVSGCQQFWPRPRSSISRFQEAAASSFPIPLSTTNVAKIYEPQVGTSANQQFLMGEFPNWISDAYGFRTSLSARYYNEEKRQYETCFSKKDYSLPEDMQNVVDYVYDSSYAKPGANIANVSKSVIDDYQSIRSGNDITCSVSGIAGTSCISTPLETIFTNSFTTGSGSYSVQRPFCSQLATSSTNFQMKIRVYNYDKESGLLPMCIDASRNWLRNRNLGSSYAWCSGGVGAGNDASVENAEALIDNSWDSRYTGWVPCENMRFCNVVPDSVTVTKGTDENTRLAIKSTTPQIAGPQQNYIEYAYSFSGITADKASSKFWGCEIQFGVGLLDLAGNIGYTPIKAPSTATVDWGNSYDHRPALKPVIPRIYFKPPPCFLCDCIACKGGKGGGSKLFNVLLFAVLVSITGGAAAFLAEAYVGYAVTTGVVLSTSCLMGGLGCVTYSDPPSTSLAGHSFAACRNVERPGYCSCGSKCNEVKPPTPAWNATLNPASPPDNVGCAPLIRADAANQEVFYTVDPVSGVETSYSNIPGLPAAFASSFNLSYKMLNPNILVGGYITAPATVIDSSGNTIPNYVALDDTVTYSAFDSANGKLCTVTVKCEYSSAYTQATKSRFNVVYQPPLDSAFSAWGPLFGCFDVRPGTKINTGAGYTPVLETGPDPLNGAISYPAPIIDPAYNRCLEVNFTGSPFNPSGGPLWSFSGSSPAGTGPGFNQVCLFQPGSVPQPGTSEPSATGAVKVPANCAGSQADPNAASGLAPIYTENSTFGCSVSHDAGAPVDMLWCPNSRIYYDPMPPGSCPTKSGICPAHASYYCLRNCTGYPGGSIAGYLPESPLSGYLANPTGPLSSTSNVMRAYGPYNAATDANLPFCTIPRSVFDQGSR